MITKLLMTNMSEMIDMLEETVSRRVEEHEVADHSISLEAPLEPWAEGIGTKENRRCQVRLLG